MSEYCLLLRKDLRKPLPAARWPEGFSLVTLSEALMQPVHALLCQGYPDDRGSIEPLHSWQHDLLHDAEYDPQLCFVTLHEGQVIAVAQAWTSAYLKDLVVHPHHQGQGLGSALLSHVFEVFRLRHEACVDLKVMEHNHRARRLYEQHGMALIRREAL